MMRATGDLACAMNWDDQSVVLSATAHLQLCKRTIVTPSFNLFFLKIGTPDSAAEYALQGL